MLSPQQLESVAIPEELPLDGREAKKQEAGEKKVYTRTRFAEIGFVDESVRTDEQ